jgi:hypothetical protein
MAVAGAERVSGDATNDVRALPLEPQASTSYVGLWLALAPLGLALMGLGLMLTLGGGVAGMQRRALRVGLRLPSGPPEDWRVMGISTPRRLQLAMPLRRLSALRTSLPRMPLPRLRLPRVTVRRRPGAGASTRRHQGRH